jgi:hypothetical protein
MKIRIDFVTNSSSSCFLIAIKEDGQHPFGIIPTSRTNEEEKLITATLMHLQSIVTGHISIDSRGHKGFYTKEDIREWCLDQGGYDANHKFLSRNQEAKKLYDEIMKYFNNDYHIVVHELDSCWDPYKEIFTTISETPLPESHFKILRRWRT